MVRGVEVRGFGVLLLGAIAAPGIIVALVTGVSGVSALVADRPLILAPVPRNAAEAAGNRDVADVLVMSSSTDMNARAEARIPLRLREPARLTPLEAAVISERAYMIRLVRDRGANLGPEELRTLRCIAEARKDRGTIAYLAGIDSSPLHCDGVTVPY